MPGVAVAAIAGGRVVLSRVHGLADFEAGRGVTRRTLFAVGSISKSFTVVALGQLAEAGRLDWDAPADRYLPELALWRFGNARKVTVRDLVAHRTGMHRHDALWYLGAFSRAGLIRRLGHLAPFAAPGEAFQYSNLMVAAAGFLAARLAGAPWESVVRSRVLGPLGLGDTRLSLKAFLAERDRAIGYFPGDDGRIRIPPRDTTAIAPASAVYSSLHDMTRWLGLFLAGGALDGRRVVAPATIAGFLEPRIAVHDDPRSAELGPVAYGMGFYLTTYRGARLARHPGVIDGYAALMSFMPDRGLGVVVLTNRSGRNPLPAVLSHAIYDRLLGLEPVAWIDRFPSARQARRRRQATKPAMPPPDGAAMTLAVAAYAGVYTHPAYGSIEISTAGATALAGRLHGIAFPLRHVGGDVWEVAKMRWPLRQGLRMRFRIGPVRIGPIRIGPDRIGPDRIGPDRIGPDRIGPDRIGRARRVEALATPLADGPTYRHNPGDLVFSRDRPGR